MARDASRPLAILEVGAGTGGTTPYVLDGLGDHRFDYLYTDLSPALVQKAQARWPQLRHEVLDIEQPPAELGRFDLVIAANVLHATRDLRKTMENVRRLVAPGGWLILVEATQSEAWGELTFGLTEGWWRFTDRGLRRDQPLIDVAGWRRLLAESGFGRGEVFPQKRQADIHQHLLVARLARRPTIAPPPAQTPRRHRPTPTGANKTPPPTARRAELEEILAELFAEILHAETIDRERSFQELGIDSLLALEVIGRLKRRLGIEELAPPVLFEHPSLERLAAHLADRYQNQWHSQATRVPPTPAPLETAPAETEPARRGKGGSTSASSAAPRIGGAPRNQGKTARRRGKRRPAAVRDKRRAAMPVAVIGYAGRFPGGEEGAAYWDVLSGGLDQVGPVPAARRRLAAGGPRDAIDFDETAAGGFLEQIETFDPLFFRLSPLEARQMDPRQRLFLETAYLAAEAAGYGGMCLRGTRSGVFVGTAGQDYLAHGGAGGGQ